MFKMISINTFERKMKKKAKSLTKYLTLKNSFSNFGMYFEKRKKYIEFLGLSGKVIGVVYCPSQGF